MAEVSITETKDGQPFLPHDLTDNDEGTKRRRQQATTYAQETLSESPMRRRTTPRRLNSTKQQPWQRAQAKMAADVGEDLCERMGVQGGGVG